MMVGIQLMANYQKTRKFNCDNMQTKVQNIIGSWRGGKFMPLINRPKSINLFCLSKLWYKCSTINLRVCDVNKISSNIKSWLFADQLEKPEAHVLFRSRMEGGLGLVSVQYKAQALLTRSFLESALIPKFNHNRYHTALYKWYVEGSRDLTQPIQPPYYDDDFFASIKMVKNEGLLDLKTMTTKMWYRVLMEENVTHTPTTLGRELIQCRPEKNHPNQDWMSSWSLSATPGLPSTLLSFLWRMTHDLLPCQTRLFRLQMPNGESNICNLCNKNEPGDLTHSLMTCPFNEHVGKFLLGALHHELPDLLPQQVTRLEVEVAKDKQLPVAFLIASVLSQVWEFRKLKKPCHTLVIRATLEAGVNILRKTRHHQAANDIMYLINSS